MKEQEILAALLKKYENSSQLLQPGKSKRRIMLNIDKNDFPAYDFEKTAVRDAYNAAAQALAAQKLISIEWLDKLPRMQKLILNLAQVEKAYDFAGREHPRERARKFCEQVNAALSDVQVEWIKCWQQSVISKAKAKYMLPAAWEEYGKQLLRVLAEYARLDGAEITMRAFSIKCFCDSKRFEREFKERFLKIAATYNEQLKIMLEDTDAEHSSWKAQLAYLGIHARPELYELSGKISLAFGGATLNLAAVYPQGLGLPDSQIDNITQIALSGIKRIIFIENKTNYAEFLQSERQETDLVLYHGGMLSAAKKKFFARIANAASADCVLLHWSDIDLGGMEMFTQLHEVIPRLQPWRMDLAAVEKYRERGLVRPEAYWGRVQTALAEHKYPEFQDVLQLLLQYRVTIEQESFLI